MKGHILNYALIINVFLGFETLKMFLCSLVSQPDLNGNPFFCDGKAKAKKRLGVEGGNSCHKNKQKIEICQPEQLIKKIAYPMSLKKFL
ncbi:hypothetical protein [Chryseobacterium piscicola]|uniref:Uncharacterized protein n=1 Tax=Chryseobacterium piscicola TaxID=551459 RepID=A0A2S7KC81_9FLAO|nr:hypothetical protein [Chryseobacterium piscicola]PQA90447.1 hypothetical protein B0A70_14020 [Chryseobacterium piscicola]